MQTNEFVLMLGLVLDWLPKLPTVNLDKATASGMSDEHAAP